MNQKYSVVLITALVAVCFQSFGHAQTVKSNADKPFVVEYYYKVKWGYADEFMRLYKKNHLPVMKAEMDLGRILSLKAEAPVYHASEESRWDYRVTITWKNSSTADDGFDESTITKKLYPDQETFKREEQRRFEILLSHTDVPIETIDLTAP
jgi:hypothetical protein